MATFKVGQRVRLKYIRTSSRRGLWKAGETGTIRDICDGLICGQRYECRVELDNGDSGLPLLEQLEPLIDDDIKSKDWYKNLLNPLTEEKEQQREHLPA